MSQPHPHSAAGVGLVELLVVIAIVGIVSAFALTNFYSSKRSFNLSGATRSLSIYLEKARLDAVRRHGSASVDINSTSTYTATMDFSGTGTLTTRTISLPPGTSLGYTLPPATTSIDPAATPLTITYDWRGRTTTAVLLTLTDSDTRVGSSTLVVGSAGDISTDTTVTGPVTVPAPQNTTVTTTSGIKGMQY